MVLTVRQPNLRRRSPESLNMDDFVLFIRDKGDDDRYKDIMGASRPREKVIQVVACLLLGIMTFLTFCVLRPRWAGLYAARKKQKHEANALPDLPTSMFGWIIPLWRITDQQVLASAGLDAYAFLAFFKLAMKFLAITFFFSIVVIKPVHDANPAEHVKRPRNNETDPDGPELYQYGPARLNRTDPGYYLPSVDTDYLWMYLILAYLFSFIAIYLVLSDTRRIIEVRQAYLGAQNSITDRTIRLSGVPEDLRDEDRIKEFIESLDIGKVESVTICRNWKELDDAVAQRLDTLRRLEEAYTIYTGNQRVERSPESLPVSHPQPPRSQRDSLLDDDPENAEDAAPQGVNGATHGSLHQRSRPSTQVRYGFLGLQSRPVDAISHYEGKLREMDEKVLELRKKTFTPTPLAFVTMDSVAAAQMALQAVLDPSPLQLIASQSPSPLDLIWTNTYLTRRNRNVRAWCVTTVIVLLTVFWSVVFVGVAGLLTLNSIAKVFPQLPELLEGHKTLQALLNGQLPVLLATLLTVLVPYLYYWLSWYQGFISQGDIELSAISKNFFFTFFNFFIVFTISGAGFTFLNISDQIGDVLKRNVWTIAKYLAWSLQRLLNFYVNFILLQGLGLFPFRLLEMGSVSLYPVQKIGAKTPRDYAELVQPPVFSYGFYLPTAMLIFIICMVYSVLRESWQVLLAGLIYFGLGHFVYKYQLLYAMDNQQQATGRAWVMICDRIFVGLVFFQLATAGQLFLNGAVARGTLMLPLVVATIWISIIYGRTYKPLMKFIALRSVKIGEHYTDHESTSEEDEDDDVPVRTNSGASADLAPERRAWADDDYVQGSQEQQEATTPAPPVSTRPAHARARFVNPSLVMPLDRLWIADKSLRRTGQEDVPNGEDAV